MAGLPLRDHRFLVTGGTGFLGTYLVSALREAGARTRVFDYRPMQTGPGPAVEGDAVGPRATPPGPVEPPPTQFVTGDLRDAGAVRTACEGVDGVFHLAALPSVARGRRHTYEAVNVQGTRHVLSAAYAQGVRKVVYVSSSTVYGVPERCPLKEDDPLHPRGPYSRTKLEAERICRGFANRGMGCSIIRPRVIIGPGRLGVFSLLFERVARGRPLYIMGAGRNRFQFTHVRDVVRGCLLAMEHDRNEIFNLGTEDIPGVRSELTALIRHAGSRSRIVSLPAGLCRSALWALTGLGIAPLVAEQFRIADKDFVLDVGKAKRVLGWRPTAGNVACLKEAYDWYVRHRCSADGETVGARLFSRRHCRVQGGFQAAGSNVA